jgi:hypothetical protein
LFVPVRTDVWGRAKQAEKAARKAEIERLLQAGVFVPLEEEDMDEEDEEEGEGLLADDCDDDDASMASHESPDQNDEDDDDDVEESAEDEEGEEEEEREEEEEEEEEEESANESSEESGDSNSDGVSGKNTKRRGGKAATRTIIDGGRAAGGADMPFPIVTKLPESALKRFPRPHIAATSQHEQRSSARDSTREPTARAVKTPKPHRQPDSSQKRVHDGSASPGPRGGRVARGRGGGNDGKREGSSAPYSPRGKDFRGSSDGRGRGAWAGARGGGTARGGAGAGGRGHWDERPGLCCRRHAVCRGVRALRGRVLCFSR